MLKSEKMKKNGIVATVELDRASMSYLPVNQVFFNGFFEKYSKMDELREILDTQMVH